MSFLRSRPPVTRPSQQTSYQRRNLAVGGGNGPASAGVSVKRKIETHKPTPPAPGTYQDYKLVSTTRDALHHVMRFHGNKEVNPMEFSAPVKLQRKRSEAPHYYRNWNNRYNNFNNQQQPGGAGTNGATGATGSANGTGGASGAVAGANGAAVPGQPAPTTAGGADISLIAPYGRGVINKQMLFKKRTKQVFLANEEERRKKEIESAPWVVEDYDSQNTFTGQLEGGQHAQYMLFVFSDDGFKVVPADKWYKFSPKIQYPTLTSEEAEEQYQKYTKQANMRWLMRKKMANKTGEEGEEGAEEDGEGDQFMAVDHEDARFDDDEDERSRKRKRGKHGDADEMDFDEVFQDDEEAPIDIPGFEEEDRDDPRRGPRGLGYGSDEDEEEDDGTKPKLDAQGREMRKALLKLEKNRVYAASDDERDPYASDKDTSDSDLDEQEKEQREKEAKKEDEQQLPSATSILEKANKKKQAAAAAAAKGSPMLGGKKNAAGKPVKPVSAKMMKGKGGAAAAGMPSAGGSPAGRASSPSAPADGSRSLSPPAGSSSKMRSTSPMGRSSSPPVGPSDKKKRKMERETGGEPGSDEVRKQRVGSSSNLNAAAAASSSSTGSGAAAPAAASAGGAPTSADGPQDDSMLITEDEVVHLLRNRSKITTRDLINELKKKLKKDVRNRNTLAQIIKKVALVQDGFLVLKN